MCTLYLSSKRRPYLLYVKIYIFDFLSGKTTLVYCKAVVIVEHNTLRLVFVNRNVILRNVLRTRCERLRIRCVLNVKVTHIFLLDLRV